MTQIPSKLLPVAAAAVLLVGGANLAAHATDPPSRVAHPHGAAVTAYTYPLRSVFSRGRFEQAFPKLPTGRDYVMSYTVTTDMTVNDDPLSCEIEANKLHGDPGPDELAVTESSTGFLVSNSATAFVTTKNRELSLFCNTDSNKKHIDSADGTVTFIPIGTSHVHTARPIPAV